MQVIDKRNANDRLQKMQVIDQEQCKSSTIRNASHGPTLTRRMKVIEQKMQVNQNMQVID